MENSFAPKVIVAAGLSYRGHVKETGEKVDPQNPLLFDKKLRSFLVSNDGSTVKIPTDEEIYTAIAKIDPALVGPLKERFAEFPKMMDYEGELGIYFTRELSLAELSDKNQKSLQDSIALFAANDLTLRSVQILGDKNPCKLAYWSAAKGFIGFMPVSTPVARQTFDLDRWPDLRIQLTVDGELRQDSALSDMLYTPRQFFLAIAKKLGGKIPQGSALITGSPPGIAFRVSPFKKFLANLLRFSAIKKLEASARGAQQNYKLLRPGAQVVVSIPGVASSRVVITA